MLLLLIFYIFCFLSFDDSYLHAVVVAVGDVDELGVDRHAVRVLQVAVAVTRLPDLAEEPAWRKRQARKSDP
jgi:hypothetical protein